MRSDWGLLHSTVYQNQWRQCDINTIDNNKYKSLEKKKKFHVGGKGASSNLFIHLYGSLGTALQVISYAEKLGSGSVRKTKDNMQTHTGKIHQPKELRDVID